MANPNSGRDWTPKNAQMAKAAWYAHEDGCLQCQGGESTSDILCTIPLCTTGQALWDKVVKLTK